MIPAVLLSFTTSLVGTWVLMRLAGPLGLIAPPNPIVPQHVVPVPQGGGIAVGVGAIAGFMAIGAETRLLLPALLFVVLGAADDVRQFTPLTKLLLQMLVAMVAVAVGVSAAPTGLAWFDTGLSVMWILIVVNAFNLIDVCDGLAGGIAAATFVAVAAVSPSSFAGSPVVAAAFLGFLVFNRPPARIYLGDAGSHLAGYLTAALAFALARPHAGASYALFFFFTPLLPLIELTSLIIIRSCNGIAPWRKSSHHLALLLQKAGCSRTVIAAGAAGVTFLTVASLLLTRTLGLVH